MTSFRDFIESLKSRRDLSNFSEADVKQTIILPVFQLLGWDIFNKYIVTPEFSSESKRVDYALCYPENEPCTFIEVKRPGQLQGADRQLFEYAFHRGVPLAVLTDGVEWTFYLPSGQGDYNDRVVYKLDINERETDESIKRLHRYLGFDNTKNGKAKENAKSDYDDTSKKRKIERTLPEAWKQLLEEPDEFLCELLADKVADKCGYKPSIEQCSDFIKNPQNISHESLHSQTQNSIRANPSQTAIATDNNNEIKILELSTIVSNELDLTPIAICLNGEWIEVRNLTNMDVVFVKWLIKKGLLKQSDIPIPSYSMRDKYFVNFKDQHRDPQRDGEWQKLSSNDFGRPVFVDTKYNTIGHYKNYKSLLGHIGATDQVSVEIKGIRDVTRP